MRHPAEFEMSREKIKQEKAIIYYLLCRYE